MDQAAKAVQMYARAAEAVEALRAAVFIPFRAEEMGFGQFHTWVYRYEAVGVFDRSCVLRVLGKRKLDHPVREAWPQLLTAVNDVLLVGAHLRNDLGPDATRGAIESQRLFQHRFVLAVAHSCAFAGSTGAGTYRIHTHR